MDVLSFTRDGFNKLINGNKGKRVIVIIGILGVALIFASSFFKTEKKEDKNAVASKYTTQEYVTRLEQNLTELVSSIKGAGESKVMVTLENSEQTVYATEERQNKEATEDKSNGQTSKKKESDGLEKKYITVKDSDGSEKALSVTQIQPTVKGVVVVCQGGDDPCVQKKVIDAIKTALNITAKRVYVTR